MPFVDPPPPPPSHTTTATKSAREQERLAYQQLFLAARHHYAIIGPDTVNRIRAGIYGRDAELDGDGSVSAAPLHPREDPNRDTRVFAPPAEAHKAIAELERESEETG